MPLDLALEELKTSADVSPNICFWHTIPARPASFRPFPETLDGALASALTDRGVSALYTHQAKAFELINKGQDIVVVTPTASGKTLCYNLPVLNTILKDDSGRALYIFPTKALSWDQMAELQELVTATGKDVKTYTYDGDTPQSARRTIRQAGHIVITNPDMLHTAILPHHTKWVKLFENLKYVVLDEIHQYRGVFGSHFANVLRRLARITEFYGSRPQFVCCSATIANPGELASHLTSRDIHLVDNNGAPQGAKHFVLYNPPVVNHDLGIRRSSLLEAQKIAVKFLNHDVQTIVFANSRVKTELLVTYLKNAVSKGLRDDNAIRGYRGGYLPNQRRQIERDLRAGKVKAVVSTDALELGIDIGQLDACVMAGYPGTVASTWQRAGRAGRRSGQAAAVLIASSSPLDQYIMSHPEYFFGKNPENALINPENLYILLNHIKCAAFELPFDGSEQFGVKDTQNILAALAKERLLHYSAGRWHWTAEDFPAEDISLRSASSENFIVIDTTSPSPRVIAEVDRIGAPMLIHEEAIYFHESRQYHVDRLEWDEKKAYVHAVDVDYYTDANLAVTMRVLDVQRDRPGAPFTKGFGEVLATAMITMFKKIKLYTHENIGSGRIHLPEEQMHTSACWICLDAHVTEGLSQEQIQSGLIGISNLLTHIAPLYLMSDPKDLRVVSEVKAPFIGMPAVYLYDSYPGGIGLAEKLYDILEHVVLACRDHLLSCTCDNGCPSCTGSMLESGPDGKRITETILGRLVVSRYDA